MKRPLLDVIFASEKRKSVLLMLYDGPKNMEILLDTLDTTRQALLPQIGILKEHYLVDQSNDTYELTAIGELLVGEMKPLNDTVEVLDTDIEYWGNHDLSFIPPHLLERIDELGRCTRVEIPMYKIFEEDSDFIKEAKRTKFLFLITRFMFPNFRKNFTDLISHGVNISIIISGELHEKILQEKPGDFEYLMKVPEVQFNVHREDFNLLSFSLTDHHVMLRVLTADGDYDNKRMICSSESARQWGKELFEHYLKDSKPMTEL